MKNYFTLILIIIISNSISAQDLPEIKMKNDQVYYEFKHTLNNKKTCISNFYTEATVKTLSKNASVKTANKSYSNYTYIFHTGGFLKGISRGTKTTFKADCIDTVAMVAPTFNITIFPEYKLVTPASALINLIKVKTFSHSITAMVEVIFISKNEYILKFKDFQYNIRTGRDYQSSVESQIPLGEVYKEFLNSEKKSKQAIEIFNAVNYFVNSSDEIYLKSLTESYKADEL